MPRRAAGAPPARRRPAAGPPQPAAAHEKIETITYSLAAISLVSIAMLNAQEVTRGVGVYPGDPHQHFSPVMVVEASAYRNLAFRRPAYHSSSYDYNLTAQLVTDGLKAKTPPSWVSIATSQQGVLPKNQRDYLLDRNPMTAVALTGPATWVQFEWGGGDGPPAVDRLEVQARVDSRSDQPQGWSCILSGSDDGQAWKELGRSSGADHPARQFKPSIALAVPARNRFYRIDFYAPSAVTWRPSELAWFQAGRRVEAGGPYNFTSAWLSASGGHEWVYVDLGAPCVFDRVKLYWIRRAARPHVLRNAACISPSARSGYNNSSKTLAHRLPPLLLSI